MKIALLGPLLVLVLSCATAPAAPPISGLEAPPWVREARLGSSEVPEALIGGWRLAENREGCAPLSFHRSSIPADATARPATFAGGWGVAFDRTSGPGLAPSGEPCANCGRSSFGIAGTGARPASGTYQWPNRREWSDGSSAGWGREGGSGENFLAYVEVAGQSCLYNLWSRRSVSHLEELIESLRMVDTQE
jgi:hypothetical protein